MHLQSGFTGVPVIVSVDGKVVYRGSPITIPLNGFADSFDRKVRRSNVILEVRVPAKKVLKSFSVDPSKGMVGISIDPADTERIPGTSGSKVLSLKLSHVQAKLCVYY